MELKPCPFCDGEAELYEGTNTDTQIDGFAVWCNSCDSRGSFFTVMNEAVEAWNKRVDITPDKAMSVANKYYLRGLEHGHAGLHIDLIGTNDTLEPEKVVSSERICRFVPFVEEDGSVFIENCSVCDCPVLARCDFNYCPNCGAKVVK